MNKFNTDSNKNLLFQILEKSKIELDKLHNQEIIRNTFLDIANLSNYTSMSLMDLNKKFIKTVVEKNKKFNSDFLMSRDERLK